MDSDRNARARSLDPGESILLQAPAGSGKTEVLTQRFLGLLAVVAEPEEILAITFTRKAAAEMRRRVVKVLDGEIDPARPTAQQLHELRANVLRNAARCGWDAQELRTRLRIQTIDSLNHELARSMPLLGRGAAGLEVTDDADALYREAARDTLHEAESMGSLQDAMDLVFRRLDNNWARAEELLAGMLARRAQWLPALLRHDAESLADAVQRSLEAIVRATLERLAAQLPATTLADAEDLLRRTAGWRAADLRNKGGAPEQVDAAWTAWLAPGARLAAEPAQLRAWQGLAALAQTQAGAWRSRFTIRDGGIPPTEKAAKETATGLVESCARIPGLREALAGLLAVPPPQLGDGERAALAALARLLRLAASMLQLCFARAGRVDHGEIANVARTGLVALGAPTELALRRATALKHLLVDEFQDTSVDQFGLLETLILGWETGADRSVFVVGDPMQSIYQFRSAEVGLFLRAREHGIGDIALASLNLTRNFRSVPPLIDWCNRAFAAVFPPQDDVRESAVRFLAAEPGRAHGASTAPHVEVHRLASTVPAEEAELLARAVVAARTRQPQASVAVLVQAAAHAAPLIDALRRHGIAVRGVDLDPLSRQPAVRDIVELGCALLHGGDRVAWLATLRAPWCGLSLADLLVLTDATPPDTPILELLEDTERCARLSIDGQLRLARCVPLLREAVAARARGDFAAALRTLWEALGGPAALENAGEWQHVQAWLDALGERLREHALPDGELLRDLAETLKVGGDTVRAESVEILTIHRAKGLEWDVVLLPGLHRAMRGDDRPLLSWIELPRPDRDVDLLMAALSIGRGRNDDRLGAYIALLRRQRLRHERCRLAYVAATRARQELHLFGHAAPDREGTPRPRGGSMLHTFWPALEASFLQDAVEGGVAFAAPPEPASSPTSQGVRRLPVHWRNAVEEEQSLRIPRLEVGAEEVGLLEPEYLWAGQRRRAIGTVVHAELERLANGVTAGEASRVLAWRLQLRELGLAAEQLDGAVADVAAVVEQVAADERARWILSAAHTEAASELRLSGIVGGELRDIVIDRTFVDADGTRWVVDYKTGTHQGANLAGFLAAELERYRPQLELYRELAAGLGPQPVRAALYFPLLRRFVELPRSSA